MSDQITYPDKLFISKLDIKDSMLQYTEARTIIAEPVEYINAMVVAKMEKELKDKLFDASALQLADEQTIKNLERLIAEAEERGRMKGLEAAARACNAMPDGSSAGCNPECHSTDAFIIRALKGAVIVADASLRKSQEHP